MRNHRHAGSALAQGLLVAATLLLGSAIAPRGYSQTENGSISGRVISEDARALPGAIVQARASSGTTFTTNTNEDGRYTLRGLPRGFYTVTASLDGFETSVVSMK